MMRVQNPIIMQNEQNISRIIIPVNEPSGLSPKSEG